MFAVFFVAVTACALRLIKQDTTYTPDKSPLTPSPQTAPADSLTESSRFFIIKSPADLQARLSDVQAALFVEDQGNDNPLPGIIPATVAFMSSAEPYEIGELKLGYLTSLIGLGDTPDAVTLKGDISVNEGIQSVDNVFFKSLQNLRIDGNLKWVTSQACPLRAVHVTGSVDLVDGCGGFIANSVIDGDLNGGGQQQYLFRNTTAPKGLSGRNTGQMNFVFLDSETGPTNSNVQLCANVTTCGTHYPAKDNPSPSVYVRTSDLPHAQDVGQKWKPIVTSAGVIFPNKPPVTSFLQVTTQAEWDQMVQAPATGLTVLVHPGVYDVKNTLKILDGMSVIGLGFPVLRSALSGATIRVVGSGTVVASVVVDAPPLKPFDQDVMIDVQGDSAQLYDIFARTYLAWFSPVQAMKTNTMLQLAGAKAFAENIWLWRGDHWSGPDLAGRSFGNATWDPFNVNPYGLYVTGNGATCLGCFVEHNLWNPIVWDGDDGLIVMSQGETAYTNNGITDPSVAGSTAKPLPSSGRPIIPGIYFTLGASVKSHTYVGGGIYNIFGTMFSPSLFPALQVLGDSVDGLSVSSLLIAGWVGNHHFSSIARYNATDYGPALLGSSESFYLCDLSKLFGGAPKPPRPPSCNGIQCVIPNTDYWGNLPDWPKGTEHSKYDPNMDEGTCCALCVSLPECVYWKEGNNNCYYYTDTAIPRDAWSHFTGDHPQSVWSLGLRDDTCCACDSGGSKTCGPSFKLPKLHSA